jgi:hypothetical protein
MNSGGYHQPLKNQPTKKKKLDLITTKRYDSFLRAVPKTQLVMMAVLDDGNQTSRQVDLMLQDKWGEVCAGEKEIGGSGGSLEPPGPLFTHLHTVYVAYSECLPTCFYPLTERTCFSQVCAMRDPTATGVEDARGRVTFPTVRAAQGRLSALSVSHSRSILYGASVWAQGA